MFDELEALREALKCGYDPIRGIGPGTMAAVYLADDLKYNGRWP